jgi:hypothetical protein
MASNSGVVPARLTSPGPPCPQDDRAETGVAPTPKCRGLLFWQLDSGRMGRRSPFFVAIARDERTLATSRRRHQPTGSAAVHGARWAIALEFKIVVLGAGQAHEAAGIHQSAWQHISLAARRAGAAEHCASDWVHEQPLARGFTERARRIPQGPERRRADICQTPHSVLFKVGDAAALIANARLNELLRDSFGLPWFRKTVIHCRDVTLRRLMNRVVCSLPDRIVIEAQGADINPEQSWA